MYNPNKKPALVNWLQLLAFCTFKPEISRHYVLLRAKRGLSLEWKLVAQQIAFYLINFHGFVKFSNLLKFCSWKQTRLRFIFLESYLSYSCFEYSTSASCETYHVCKLVLPLKKQQQRNALGFCLTGFWWKVSWLIFCHIIT